MRKIVCPLLILTAFAARAEPASVVSLPDRLTLEEALRLFHEHGFDLLIAEAAVQSAQGDLISARQIPNPSVQTQGSKAFHYDPTVDGCEGCSSTGFTVGAGDNGALFDTLIGKRRLKIRVAEAALAAARQSRADAGRTLTTLVKQQYVQTVLAKADLEAAERDDKRVKVL